MKVQIKLIDMVSTSSTPKAVQEALRTWERVKTQAGVHKLYPKTLVSALDAANDTEDAVTDAQWLVTSIKTGKTARLDPEDQGLTLKEASARLKKAFASHDTARAKLKKEYAKLLKTVPLVDGKLGPADEKLLLRYEGALETGRSLAPRDPGPGGTFDDPHAYPTERRRTGVKKHRDFVKVALGPLEQKVAKRFGPDAIEDINRRAKVRSTMLQGHSDLFFPQFLPSGEIRK